LEKGGSQNPKSIVLLADQAQRQWPSHLLSVVETLVRQFAMCSHYLRSFDALERPVIDLQQLNWYKHRCLETFHHAVATSISGLVELPKDEGGRRREGANGSVSPSSLLNSHTPALQKNSTPESLRRTRSLQLLHHLENTVATLSPLLDREQWQFNLTLTQIPLANLLKRSLLLLTPLTKAQQLSVTVHIPSTERVYSDRLKLECVLLELLLSAARACPPGGRINIWCRQVASQESEVRSQQQPSQPSLSSPGASVVELLITDKIAPEFMNTQSSGMNAQPIYPVREPTSLNLKICQRVVRSWGSDLHFYQLEGSRYYTSRLLLPRVDSP
jgi:signal transduction histidine kinase